ncbi:cadherin-related family member 2 [Thalassophryne amazonica]|uniref:cadherin-related family member 2 n=1 Tax=Thalassophryne amazonica TaxID=390379 RepID=UPI001470F096|nr:cadherin-related family member 2 [Thalassophryne amazonica]
MNGITGIILLFLIGFTSAIHPPVIGDLKRELCEDIPIGGYAFTIWATDADNDRLTYSMSGEDARFFLVNANTGNVTVKSYLDREAKSVLLPDVTVSDDESLSTALVGTTLFTVRATDDDIGAAGRVTYNIDDVTPEKGSSLFNIGSTSGVVTLVGQLNYTHLSSFYWLKINASDGGGQCGNGDYVPPLSSMTFSVVTVEDRPDLDPRFTRLPYFASVEEHSPKDMSILEVLAIDPDTGINDIIKYSIEHSSKEGLFKISENEGIISVMSSIDREEVGDDVTLTVKATESSLDINGVYASTTAEVQINIININDNIPTFLKCEGTALSCVNETQFTGEIEEHSPGLIPLKMKVQDRDKNSKISLTLEGTDKNIFSVEPSLAISESDVQLMVRQSQELDFEKICTFVVQVIATDQENTTFQSTATVTIKIKDINDNIPEFPKDTYQITVPEHSPNGTVLDTIVAEDPDTMDKDKLVYSLLPESIRLYFDVEPHTGAIYVANSTLIDREVRSLYSATLQAKDTSNKTGSTVLEITLNDINDKPPVMNRNSYQEFVKEGQNFQLQIQADDADDPETQNSQIVYAIVPSVYSNNFTIDPNTGMLKNNGELDRESLDPKLNGKIELIVTATDKGVPALSSNATVTINIDDINDNAPQFDKSSYKFFVKEGVKGAYVGTVSAEDLDQTAEFNRISFSIIEGSFGSFIIRSYQKQQGYGGNITVDQDIELDYESDRNKFKLQVQATDMEQDSDVVMVDVDVLDVNDERPEFIPSGPLTVKEGINISEPIGNFTAVDKDGNHLLVYELESLKCICGGTLENCNWFILDPSGEIRVTPGIEIDYEKCNQAVMEAQVVDKNTEKGENNSATPGVMVINIEDINDNAPEFITSNSVFVVVSEMASKGTSVAAVAATDRDSGINKVIVFKVTAVEFKDTNNQITPIRTLFEAITTQQNNIYVGIIQPTENLDTSLKGKYLVTVSATDTGDLSNSTVLELFTVDESYKVKLEFTSSIEEVESNKDEIERVLTAATKTKVHILGFSSVADQTTRAQVKTVAEAYFVYPNGTALNYNSVTKLLSDPEYVLILGELGLAQVGSSPLDDKGPDTVQYVLVGIVGGLIIVLVILITSLMCTRRNYQRKLKAANAINNAAMLASENQTSGAVVPGTNKYNMEGANPVLNLNIDTALVLDMDAESSDVDKVSLNSLDYSEDMSDKDTNPEKEKERKHKLAYIEPLDEALAHHGQKKGSDSDYLAFNNPLFSATDL